MHFREDPALISFAADALLPVQAPALLLLPLLTEVDGVCESDDSRELIAILRDCIEKDPAGIEAENERLFVGRVGKPVCAPWQSAYIDDVHDAEAIYAQALEWHERAGLGSKTEYQPADHIGILLKIYARLLESESDDAVLDRFRREHLTWIPTFCAHLRHETTHGFYRALAVWLSEEVRGPAASCLDPCSPGHGIVDTHTPTPSSFL